MLKPYNKYFQVSLGYSRRTELAQVLGTQAHVN